MRRPPCGRTGLDVLASQAFAPLRGLRVGLVTHPAAVDAELRHAAKLLAQAPDVRLVALFGPEHGLLGEAQDLIGVGHGLDPLSGLRVTLLGGSAREQGSNDAAFSHAAHLAFEQALAQAGPTPLEPVMDFEIRVPADFLPGVNADLNSRRARVRSLATETEPAVIRGTVPLAEIFGYSTALRSLTQGRAAFSMEFSRYQPVPAHVAETVLHRRAGVAAGRR